jgi:hypothetical protein
MTHRRHRGSVAILMAWSWLAIAGFDRAAWSADPPPARGFGASAPNPVEPIVKRMKAAQTRLKEGDTGPDTRGIQQQVVDDLEKLINAASRQSGANNSRKSSSQGQSSQQDDKGSQSPQSQQQQQQQPGGSEAAPGTNGGAPPGASRNGRTRPVAVAKKVGNPGERTLAREVWGHLPPAVRERVRVDFSETVLPAYDELVRRYFEALLEDAPQRRGSAAPVPGSAAPDKK